jgi:diadenylate cyclase
MNEFFNIILYMELRDWVDILLVAALFYTLLSLLRKTRSSVAVRGLVGVLLFSFLIYFLANLANLSALIFIFERFWIIAVILFVVIFQNDLRFALIELGQFRAFRAFFSHSGKHFDEIISAVSVMSSKRIGALIAIERHDSLKVYADTGAILDAALIDEVLRAIFTPPGPLHDGAVIIRSERILAAAAILPLSESSNTMGRGLGTRHLAAFGLSEETDALVIVVSEETGIISLAHRGQIERGLTPDSLKSSLWELMKTEGLE